MIYCHVAARVVVDVTISSSAIVPSQVPLCTGPPVCQVFPPSSLYIAVLWLYGHHSWSLLPLGGCILAGINCLPLCLPCCRVIPDSEQAVCTGTVSGLPLPTALGLMMICSLFQFFSLSWLRQRYPPFVRTTITSSVFSSTIAHPPASEPTSWIAPGYCVLRHLKNPGNMKKNIDNIGANVVILMYWRFFKQRMIVNQREGNPDNYIRFAFLPC